MSSDVDTAYANAAAAIGATLKSAGLSVDAITANCPPAPLDPVLVFHARQPEADLTPGAYVRRLVTAERVAQGQAKRAAYSALLADICDTFDVDIAVLLAIWGVETNFGASQGAWPVLGALNTLAAADRRRRDFWVGERDAALKILRTHVARKTVMLGSWAGAMGQVQFMPSTYARFAVDFDLDGFPDIWTSVPDALASAARFLAAHGSVDGRVNAVRVRAASAFDWTAQAGQVTDVFGWAAVGLEVLDRQQPSSHAAQEPLRLLAPEGALGPLFLVGVNFDAILAYNPAVSYALAVCELARKISHPSHMEEAIAWRSADHGLTRAQKLQLQRRLSEMGWDTGGIDGILGHKSRVAIRELQLQIGRRPDGYADRDLFNEIVADGGRDDVD